MSDVEITWELAREWPLCSDCDERIEDFFTSGSSSSKPRVKFEYGNFVEAWEFTECALCQAIVEACDQLLAGTGGGSQKFISIDIVSSTMLKVFWGSTMFISIRKVEERQDLPGPDSIDWRFDIKSDKDGNLTPEVVSFMKQQLATCLGDSGHANCRPDPGFGIEWPARLLKITLDRVILVDFEDQMMGNFAALSYCWGSKEEHQKNAVHALQLNASTKQTLRTGIPTSRLPVTLRQSVEVCRLLDIEYIWIDALCIIQDDSLDWMAEAKKMATVYTMAKITIIATGASSSYDGFLKKDLNSAWLDSPLMPPHQMAAQMYCTSGFHTNRRLHRAGSDPIDSRGWTYQEELLSTRMLRFTKEDVQWQCNTHTACVCRQPVWNEVSYYLDQNSEKPDWCDLMPHFSPRDFSIAVDRLPALSGLARKYAYEHRHQLSQGNLSEPVYIAGNWKHQLLPNTHCGTLAWKAIHFLNPQSYNNAYVAPSFSWASVKGYVVFDATFPTVVLSEILDARTTLVSSTDPFGRISDGLIVLSGPVISCCIVMNDDASAKWYERLTISIIGEEQDKSMSIGFCEWDCPIGQGKSPDGQTFLRRLAETATPSDLSSGATNAQILLLLYGKHKREGEQFVGLVLGQEPSGKRHQRLAFVTLKSLDRDVDVDRLKKYKQVVTIG
ncbi:heterokaryon incompatibility protein-domain-containing protein [Cladorrhinum sp. PSN259]|nr:heterokaryon incompatibility protein-domain-containing protein [Cladorrhinum sp. PSN259]